MRREIHIQLATAFLLFTATINGASGQYLGAEDRSAAPAYPIDTQVPGAPYQARTQINRAIPPQAQASPTSAQPGTTSSEKTLLVEKLRRDRYIARRMVRNPWFYQAALSNPEIVAAVCAHADTAKLLAKSRHLAEVADADHYLCRRLTQWKAASYALVYNPNCYHVVALDPMGIYFAIDRDPKIGRLLSKNIKFTQMIVENPDLGKVLAEHSKGQPFEH